MSKLMIGYMQGRLSPLIGGKIQCFPWDYWKDEFPKANKLGLTLMEWTLDQERLYQNPIMNEAGQTEIKLLSQEYGVKIPSLTGDCFMQAPFYKKEGPKQSELQKDFIQICEQSAKVGVEFIVVPLVDAGALENSHQEDVLINFLMGQNSLLLKNHQKIVFESDYTPKEVARFINRLPRETFGINYDSGNSAALGWNPQEEFRYFGDRILNFHIKDRVKGGTTVPLGTGDCDFDEVFSLIKKYQYRGNLILQTARANDEDHEQVLAKYIQLTKQYL